MLETQIFTVTEKKKNILVLRWLVSFIFDFPIVLMHLSQYQIIPNFMFISVTFKY